MISLLFKFLGDSTPLKREAEKAKGEMGAAGSNIGKEFGSQMKSTMMQYIGISAIASMVKKTFADVSAAEMEAAKGAGLGLGIRETQALMRAEKATGMTRAELLEAGKRNPQEFADLIKKHESPLGETDIKSIASEGGEFKNSYSYVSEQIAAGTIMALTRARGLFQGLGGMVLGDEAAQEQGAVRLFTGMSPDPRQSAEARFVSASQSDNASFAALVDELIEVTKEEQQKTRAAIERN